jgi:hypothetical protein
MLGIHAPAKSERARRARGQGDWGMRAGIWVNRGRGDDLETGDDHAGSGRTERRRGAWRGAGAPINDGESRGEEGPDILSLMTPLP